MRTILALLSLISPLCLASQSIGSDLTLLENQGQPRLSVTFDTDQPLFFASFVMDGRKISSKPIRSLAIRAWDESNKRYLTEWESILTLPKAVYLPHDFTGNWWIDDQKTAHLLIKTLPNLKLVLGVSESEAKTYTTVGFVNLRAYCRSAPKTFLNLLNNSSGC